MQPETVIPLFPLGLVLLPQMPLPLHIFEERYKLMIGECIENNTAFGVVYFNGYGFTETMNFKSISFVIAGCEGFSKEEKQLFLEMTSTYKRLKKSVASLEKIIERTKITSEIRKIIGGNGDMAKFTST